MSNLPFTYNWLLSKSIKKDGIKTVLELGCGKGDFADLVNKNNRFDITGVDIFEPYLKICKIKSKYKKLIKKDLSKKLLFKDKSFDAVVCLQTIEHLDKQTGIRLLAQIERIAKKMIIITTPVGECLQDSYDNNIHQRHLSSWDPEEFQKSGYRVFGVGLKLVYGSQSHAEKQMTLLTFPLFLLSFLANPIANLLPKIGCQMLSVKNKKN